MLKLIYSETGLHLEQFPTSLDAFLQQRVQLALRTGQTLYLEPGQASIVLPTLIAELPLLEQMTKLKAEETKAYLNELDFDYVDSELLEVSFYGTWIAAFPQSHEGTFVTRLGDRLEVLLYQLWQMAQLETAFLSR